MLANAAGPLVLCSGKGLGNLRCKYHGWLYNQAGQLVAAPEMQDAQDFRVADVRLPQFRVREWQGLVFVALADDVPDLDRVYAGITERIAPVELGVMQFVRRDSWDVECNWKVYVDNDREFTNNIQEEGVDICERVQVGLASGQYRAGRLCPKCEAGVWHFHQRLRAVYDA